MWLACGSRLYLFPGPRCCNDNGWYRVAEKARLHLTALREHYEEFLPQVVDKLPTTNGAADTGSSCFVVAMLAHAEVLVPERQARLFYDVCARQLVSWVALEQLPANQEAGSYRHQEHKSYPGVQGGKILKSRERRRQQRRHRSEKRTLERGEPNH
ncbi:unnamed protein product [Nippostrongylus brasiliensis]|uniref:Pyridoxal kinase n=1 Tax=Nippostrongylus brasiliensis TaxID=27835 RepID=A0A0N4YFZ6_NIPBR|nr:unnamed protein product [Nippostrongylus brasiliensis]